MTPEFPRPKVPVVPRLAAAAVVLRDRADRLEVLVGQRTTSARFMGGFWVFPGGQVDPADGPGEAGFRRAAARELSEEAGIEVDVTTLVPFDRWITPEPLPRRFDTFFFVAGVAAEVAVRIDGQEIVASRWATPAQLLEDADAGRTLLAFPTLRQLEKLRAWSTVADALRDCAATSAAHGTPSVLVPGDARHIR